MLIRTQPTILPRSHVVNALSQLRQEWQEVADGDSLVNVKARVGLILAEVSTAIGLTTMEQIQVLGADLTREIDESLSVRYRIREA